MNSLKTGCRPIKIIRFLGRGASGEVFLSFDPYFDPAAEYVFALKLLSRKGESPEYWKYYSQFMKTQWKRSANLYGFEFIHSRRALKIEYIYGPVLSSVLLDLVRHHQGLLCKFLLQVREAIDELHQKKISHGDISLSNVILNPEKGAVLIDHEPRNSLVSYYAPSVTVKKDEGHDIECYVSLLNSIEAKYSEFFDAQTHSVFEELKGIGLGQWKNKGLEIDMKNVAPENCFDLSFLNSNVISEQTLSLEQNSSRRWKLWVLYSLGLLLSLWIPGMTNTL